MEKFNGKRITIVNTDNLPDAATVRRNYIANMREYIATQNYVGKVQECVNELLGISEVIKENNNQPFIDPNGIVNEQYVDLESTKVRIVALTKAIDTNLKLLNKVLPDARENISREMSNDDEQSSETFAHAIREVEKGIAKQRLN
jgi:phosphate uptake regulator